MCAWPIAQRCWSANLPLSKCVIVENVNFLDNVDVDGKLPPPTGAPNIMA